MTPATNKPNTFYTGWIFFVRENNMPFYEERDKKVRFLKDAPALFFFLFMEDGYAGI